MVETGSDKLIDPVPARTIEWLIDNAEAYDALLIAIQEARTSVWMTQLALDADCAAYGDAGSSGGRLLLDALLHAPGNVDVRVLLNATLLLDTTKPLRRALASRPDGGRGIQLRGIRRFPQLLHAKMVIVDSARAFLLGSPFVNGYWDTPRHDPVDARRPARELGGRPLHDVSVAITGAVVSECVEIFGALWKFGDETGGRARDTASARSARVEHADGIAIVMTSPDGPMETLDALLVGIASARRSIYIEHQYLSARPVVGALADALAREPALEIIVVLNENPDVTAYRGWQKARLTESGLLGHPRVGLFGLWSTRPGPLLEINQIFVHSKVVIVDDEWAMVGSANLDGVSLHSYGDDFSGMFARWLFRDVRNFDIGVVVRDPVVIAELRERLWSEHLGLARAQLPGGGSGALRYWRAAAAWNVHALSIPEPIKGFVLPFSLFATPAEQLAEIGVHDASPRLNLCFNPGWLEINFSPNWVRNMFL